MRQVRYHEHGGPEVLRVDEVEVPEPGEGQVRVAVEAAAANFADLGYRSGTSKLPWRRTLPGGLLGDVVGTVDALGAGVTGLAIGQRVAAVADPGVAEKVVVDASSAVPVPADLDAAQASIVPMAAVAAAGALEMGRLAPGETVLVHAAAGGIGHLALQLAKVRGAGLVIGTASTGAKLDFARAHGADVAVKYTEADWPDQVRAVAPGQPPAGTGRWSRPEADGPGGVDVVLDSVGGEVLRHGLDLLAPYGRLVVYGAASGDLPTIAGLPLMLAHRYVTGFSMGSLTQYRPAEFRRLTAEIVGHVVAGRLRTAVHATVPMTEAAEVHRMMENREQLGRIMFTI